MKGKCFMCIVVFTIGVFALSLYSFAQEISADFLMKEKGVQESIKGKIFIKRNNMRKELFMGQEKQVMIVRHDKGVIWNLMPKEKMYMEMPLQMDDKKFERWSSEKESSAQYLGTETISGVLCKKYQYAESGEKTAVWVSDTFPFPIRVEHQSGFLEYRNIKKANIADSLFEIPPGYMKMSLPMMPGGMGLPR
ncbi:MAG: DUF4412 domain-containing protein [Thermodesulfobacteriota bacterium]|nr:DUF4412 domain-containing protein [Thermodesulfobacteriota bacterium]